MKLKFLYTDESYKEQIKDIKIGDSVTLSHTNESGLFIFSYEVKGENKDSARMLINIKSQVEKVIDKEKCFLLDDGASEYYNKKLYPLYNRFERNLRQLILLLYVKYSDEDLKIIAKNIEEKTYNEIGKILFSNKLFFSKVEKKIKSYKDNDCYITKQAFIDEIAQIPYDVIWDNKFTRRFHFVKNNFKQIKDYRNDVMHAHNMTYEKFQDAENIIKQAIKEIQKIIKAILANGVEINKKALQEILSINLNLEKIKETMKPFVEHIHCFMENNPLKGINSLCADIGQSIIEKIAEENSNG